MSGWQGAGFPAKSAGVRAQTKENPAGESGVFWIGRADSQGGSGGLGGLAIRLACFR
jgi:hypothetical protein